MNKNFIGLAHIGIYTEDIQISKKFYCDYLGFEVMFEQLIEKPNNEWLKIMMLNLNGMIIELLEPSDKTNIKKGNNGSVDHFAIEVKNLNDIVKVLNQKGIIFETEQPRIIPQLFKGVSVMFFRGPSGERIELFEYLT